MVDALADRRLLLLLDNCEHVIDAAATLVGRILERRGSVHVLATTRQPLGIPGESKLALEPLPVPDTTQPNRLDDSEAVRLFTERAVVAQPRLRLEDHVPAIHGICRLVGGLPLALELATARLRGLSPEELAGRLHDQLSVLRTTRRTGDLRHATMEATIAWSWELLDADEQTLFSRLAFFPSTWSLEAAEAICGFEPLLAGDVLDLQTSLLEKSLVTLDDTDGPVTRYRMLETIRQFGERQLTAAATGRLRHRHIDYWRHAFPISPIERRTQWDRLREFRSLEPSPGPDLPNLTAAMDWALEAGRWEDAMRILGGGFGLLLEMGSVGFELTQGWMEPALDYLHTVDPAVMAQAIDNAATIAFAAGHAEHALEWDLIGVELAPTPRARHHFQTDVAIAHTRSGRVAEGHAILDEVLNDTDDPTTAASVLFWKSESSLGQERWNLMERAMSMARIEDLDAHSDAHAWFRISQAAAHVGRYDTATEAARQSLELARDVDHRVLVVHAGLTLAHILTAQGNFDEAQRRVNEALPLVRQILGTNRSVPELLTGAATIARRRGDIDTARSLIQEYLNISDLDPGDRAYTQIEAARLACDQGNLNEAERLLAEASIDLTMFGDYRQFFASVVRSVEATIAARRREPERALELLDGLLDPADRHGATLQHLDTIAIALIQKGDAAPAAKLVGFVDAERDRTGLVVPRPDHSFRESVIAEGRALLGPAWVKATEADAAMTLTEAIDFARRHTEASQRPLEHPSG